MKKACAKEALKLVPSKGVIGLGGGETIGYLAEFIKEAGLAVSAITPSADTRKKCIQLGIPVIETETIDEVEIAFDGCDQVDTQLNATKSGGGIHTREKIIGRMAREYIFLVDESKVVTQLDTKVPIVLEIVPEAKSYLMKELNHNNMHCKMRNQELMEVYIEKYPKDVGELDAYLKSLTGVIETSLFYQVGTMALVATKSGTYQLKRKGER